MATAFETFVNVELPNRPWINVPLSGSLTTKTYMRATGVGMQLEEADPTLLDSAPGTASYSGIHSVDTVGESVSFGDVLYLKSDSKYWKALGTNSSSTYPAVVMALGSGIANAQVHLLHIGFVKLNAWSLSIGNIYLSSSTSGAFVQAQPSATGNIVQILGYAKASNIMLFNPNQVWIEV